MIQDVDARTYQGASRHARHANSMHSICVVLLRWGVGEQSATWPSALPGPEVDGAGLVSAYGIGVLLEDVRATSCHHPVWVKQNGGRRRLGAHRLKHRSDF